MKFKLLISTIISVLLFTDLGFAKEENWKEFKKQHFIIYYQNAPIDFIKTINNAAESYYEEITKNLGFRRMKSWSWDERAKIYVYDNADDYLASGKIYGWSHGVANPSLRLIRTFPQAHGFFDSTLPHELGHIIFREFVGYKSNIPLWFEEGVAMYQEKAKRYGANQAVKEAMELNKFIPLGDLGVLRLRSTTPKDVVTLFYAEAASVVYFLITEHGKTRFSSLCRKLKEGKPFEWALKEVYIRYKTVHDLNKSWLNYLKKQ